MAMLTSSLERDVLSSVSVIPFQHRSSRYHFGNRTKVSQPFD